MNELDSYMQQQPTVGQENVDTNAVQEAQRLENLAARNLEQQNQNQNQNQDQNQNNVYETLYQWGIENNIFDVDADELRQYDPNFDINSEDGFRTLMQVQAELLAEDIIKQRFSGWNDNTVSDFIEAINNGASISDFAAAYGDVDWTSVDLRSAVNQRAVIRKDLEVQGKSPQYINDYIQMLENSNKLREYSVEHQNSLVELQQQNTRAYIENLKINQEFQQKQLELYEQSFANHLQYTDQIAGLPIADEEKQQLYDFVFDVRPLQYEDGTPYIDENGNQAYGTDYQLMMEQLDESQQLELHLLIARYFLNGLQLGGINQMYNQQLNTLEQRLRNVNLTNQNKNPDYNNNDALAQHVYSGR